MANPASRANRFYIERPIYDAFMERFVRRVAEMKVGYGLDDGVEIGSLIDADALETAIAHIDDARQPWCQRVVWWRSFEDLQGLLSATNGYRRHPRHSPLHA